MGAPANDPSSPVPPGGVAGGSVGRGAGRGRDGLLRARPTEPTVELLWARAGMGRRRQARSRRSRRWKCALWTGRAYRGYGIRSDGKAAHRAAYERAYGPIPAGLQVHHLCGRKLCMTPAHLVAMTAEEHLRVHARPALALLRARA